MKIMQNIMSDLLFNKNDSGKTAQTTATAATGNNQSVLGLESAAGIDGTAVSAEVVAEDLEAQTVEALTQDKNLTPEQKKQIEKLMKDPHLTQEEKVQAITLMLRKHLPLTKEVMHTVHQGLREPLLPESVSEAVAQTPTALELIPELLKSLIGNLTDGTGSGTSKEASPDAILTIQLAEVLEALAFKAPSGAMKDSGVEHLLQKMTETDSEPFGPVTDKPIQIKAETYAVSSPQPLKETPEGQLTEVSDEPLSETAPEEDVEKAVAELVYALLSQAQSGQQSGVGSDSFQGKIFLRQEVKAAMQSAKADFEAFRETAVKQLKTLDVEAPAPNQQQILQKAIEAVDRVIMKSDIPLYTSMKMEKQLLVLSSNLQDVKSLAGQGKWDEAREGLKKIVDALENMQFKPSAKKMIYRSGYINAPAAAAMGSGQVKGLDLSGLLGKQISAFSELKASPRMVLEHLRGLGYNEGAEQQHGRSQHNLQTSSKHRSLYQVLESLSQDSASKDSKDKEKENQWPKMLTESVGAHRLVNKLEEGSLKQSMDLTIPYRIHEEVSEIKVHIDARKQDELLDWENFQMFFVMDTKHMGQVGIGVHTVDRKLSLSFKAENRRTVNKLAPLADGLKKSLVGVGYQLVGIQYGLLGESTGKPAEPVEVPKTSEKDEPTDKKGVDIKV